MQQPSLFLPDSDLPPGMVYREEFITPSQESRLLERIRELPFCEAQYREWQARRRIVSYGGRYDFHRNVLVQAESIPSFLHPLREQIAAWTGDTPTQFSHALINEYSPGTPLGWHRDAPPFGTVVGVSLAGPGRMRLRTYPPSKGRAHPVKVLDMAPRSAYILRGAARQDWQHAISPTRSLRYSITFRTLASHAPAHR